MFVGAVAKPRQALQSVESAARSFLRNRPGRSKKTRAHRTLPPQPKQEEFIRRRCTRKDTTPVLFAFGELYCFAVIFGYRRVILPSAVYWQIKYH